MTAKELSQTFTPQDIEKEIYDWWEREGYFRPEKQEELGLVKVGGPHYCLTLPPPNITGVLHLGHAIVIALEDSMCRFERMRGKQTLFLPGSDHAGIATQNVVERELAKQGITRKDLGRKKFVEKVWEWKVKYHARITEQSKCLGMSSDWTRERFTLDENLSKAVRTAFVNLYKKKLIYKGTYMVNWCPRCESAISDLEAEPEDEEGHLWFIKYPVINKDWSGPSGEWGSGAWAKGATEFIILATTRPETLLGDTAVATAPNHPDWGGYVGKKLALPVVGRAIPVIEDSYVDPEFGTGALKITPAHDPADYEIGKRHSLAEITVIDEKGKMVPEYSGPYAGQDRDKCRQAIVDDLKKEGLLTKITPYSHAVAHCQRCHTTIEPRISTQWFVHTKDLAEAALLMVRDGQTKIIPEREEDRFRQWMENIKDWCISRQLWWGHQIPVWYCQNNHIICELEDPTKCPECGSTNLTRDEDVLDTWFSSGLWPFSTLGWPNVEHPDFKRYYPTDMRETAYDILFFWVAREMMMGIELTHQIPYRKVYCHGIVRNEKGQKISKSMENVEQYDPLKIIAEFGADALRYTLVSNSVPGQDINLDRRHIDASARFCNKIWQSTKFALANYKEGEQIPPVEEVAKNLHYTDLWILSCMNRLIQQVTEFMDKNDYLNACRIAKNFYWAELCDWYIELSKSRLYGEDSATKIAAKATLCYVLDTCFRLLHPVMPFITEHLWQRLPSPYKKVPALIVAQWPIANTDFISDSAEETFNVVRDLIEEIRSVRSAFHFPPGDRVAIYIESGNNYEVIERGKADIISLARINPDQFYLDQSVEPQSQVGHLIVHGMHVRISLGNIDIKTEIARIKKEITELDAVIRKSENLLNGQFATRAPPEIVQAEREKLRENQEKKQKLNEQLIIIQPDEKQAKKPSEENDKEKSGKEGEEAGKKGKPGKDEAAKKPSEGFISSKTPVKRPTKPKAKQAPKPKSKPGKK